VAKFEYTDYVEVAKEKKSRIENKFSMSGSGVRNYWEELLKDKYQENKVEKFNIMGKGKQYILAGYFASLCPRH
jgi:chromodomain-helicase-DNA-binding protein 4